MPVLAQGTTIAIAPIASGTTRSFRVGIDTGGTHTDLVLVDEAKGSLLTYKLPSTLHDLSDGIVNGLKCILDQAEASSEAIGRLVYATTMVTNLIVEGIDAPVGLITTEGFRDVLELGRASRKPHIYDIQWRPAPPLVPRPLRLGVRERIDHSGAVVDPLDESDARQALRQLKEAGCTSIAVCFLNAYSNPVHEQRVAALAEEECPDIDVSLSCSIVREFREYERVSTTVLNAYVKRPLSRHLTRLSDALADCGVRAVPFIMRGNGGISTCEAAKALPVAVTHSGPMGGIVGGTAIAAACGITDIITLDMGGTSADVSLVVGGKPVLTTRGKLGPYPLLLPMLDLVTIGAGGGSIAWVDQGGALRVGPRSAGAHPGPACYGDGGQQPTVTDANLFTGRLNAGYFLEGRRQLHSELAGNALRDKITGPLGLEIGEAALGILAIAESHMVNAIKLISVDRGLDPRDFTLVAFGGAGPLHALRLAEELAIDRVLIPPAPGNVSSLGLLAADIRHDLVRTRVGSLVDVGASMLAADFQKMGEEAMHILEREDVLPDKRLSLISLDLRYHGQNYELNLSVHIDDLTEDGLALLAKRFHEEHKRVYGYDLSNRTVQVVNLRLTAIGCLGALRLPRFESRGTARPVGARRVMIGAGTMTDVPVYRATELYTDQHLSGPAIVEYPGSTLFVPPGWHGICDNMRNAHLRRLSGASRP